MAYKKLQFVQGTGKALSLVNPKDAKNIGFSANSASREQVEEAVCNARKAFTSGPWRSWSGEQRAAAINKLADLMDQNAEAIAYLESISSGRLIAMLVDEVSRTTKALRCKYFPDWLFYARAIQFLPNFWAIAVLTMHHE